MFILVKDIFDNLGRTCNFSSCVIYKRDTETEVSQCIPYKGNRDLSVQILVVRKILFVMFQKRLSLPGSQLESGTEPNLSNKKQLQNEGQKF